MGTRKWLTRQSVLLKKAFSRAAVSSHAVGCGRKNVSVVVDRWPKSHVLERGGQNMEGKGSRTVKEDSCEDIERRFHFLLVAVYMSLRIGALIWAIYMNSLSAGLCDQVLLHIPTHPARNRQPFSPQRRPSDGLCFYSWVLGRHVFAALFWNERW